MPTVLIADPMSARAEQVFRDHGIAVDVRTGLSPAELLAIIGQYDGLAIRSATKVSSEILEGATNLKVVGRAGIGVDNVDIAAASKRGVIVMNTPYGNTVTTAVFLGCFLVGSSRVDLQACKLEYSIVSPK